MWLVRSGYWRCALPFRNDRLKNSTACHNIFRVSRIHGKRDGNGKQERELPKENA